MNFFKLLDEEFWRVNVLWYVSLYRWMMLIHWKYKETRNVLCVFELGHYTSAIFRRGAFASSLFGATLYRLTRCLTGSPAAVSLKTAEIAGDLWETLQGPRRRWLAVKAAREIGAERDRPDILRLVNPKACQCRRTALPEYRHVSKTGHVPRGTSNASASIRHAALLTANLESGVLMGLRSSPRSAFPISRKYPHIYRRCFAGGGSSPDARSHSTLWKHPKRRVLPVD